MEILYYENPYMKEFIAEVVQIVEKEGLYHVVLDKTYFYPGKGEFPKDAGCIDQAPVLHVYEEEEMIYHVVKQKPMRIHKVKCTLDWKRRLDFMQQYLGQTILSACFTQLYYASTVKLHLGDKNAYMDIDKTLGEIEINKVETLANVQIMDNISTEICYLNSAELKKLSMKKTALKKGERIRVLRIGDLLATPCDGLPLGSTLEVQMIKIIHWEKLKNGTRINFLCGGRALQDAFSQYEKLEKITKACNCASEKVVEKVQDLAGALNSALAERNTLKAEVAQYEVQHMLNSCEPIKGVRVLQSIYENTDVKYASLLASKLTAYEKVVVLFAVKAEEKVQLLFMCSKDLPSLHMSTLLKDAITLIDGKGGGNAIAAQGGGKNNSNVEACLDYASQQIYRYLQ